MSERAPIYNSPQLVGIQPERYPNHMGVVLDGNGRWAEERGAPISEGHRAGAENFARITRELRDIEEVSTVSGWALATKNVDNRDQEEIATLMSIMALGFSDQSNIDDLMDSGTKFMRLGRRSRLTPELIEASDNLEDVTRGNTRHTLALFIDYGWESELEHIVAAAKEESLADDTPGSLLKLKLPEFAKLVPMDVLMRSGVRNGNLSISDLGPVVGEAIIYPLKAYWPDVKMEDFLDAIKVFANTNRKFGGRLNNGSK